MSYVRSRGFGQVLPGGYPLPITKTPVSVSQPTGSIQPMVMMQTNPMLPGGEAAAGDQAMMMEMQARSGDPAAYQQPMIMPGISQATAPTSQLTQIPMPAYGPTPMPVPQTQMPQTSDIPPGMSESQFNAIALQMMIAYWTAVFSGQEPHHDLKEIFLKLQKMGKMDIVAKAEEIVTAPKSQPMPVQNLPASISPTMIPVSPITQQGPPVAAPMPSGQVTAQSFPAGMITKYAPETGLYPAQPGGTIQPTPPPPPASYSAPVGPITTQGVPAYQPITTQGNPPTGTIPPGPGQTASIPQGQLPPTTQQYVATPAAAAAAAVPVAKSNIVPIALAAGAALLLARFMK